MRGIGVIPGGGLRAAVIVGISACGRVLGTVFRMIALVSPVLAAAVIPDDDLVGNPPGHVEAITHRKGPGTSRLRACHLRAGRNAT